MFHGIMKYLIFFECIVNIIPCSLRYCRAKFEKMRVNCNFSVKSLVFLQRGVFPSFVLCHLKTKLK